METATKTVSDLSILPIIVAAITICVDLKWRSFQVDTLVSNDGLGIIEPYSYIEVG